MKKIFFIIALAASLFASEYKVDKEYSTISFEVNKLLFISIEGEFSEFSGTVKLQNNKLSSINGLVFVDSINTNNEERDEHLKANDYFNSASFSNIVFQSNTITDDAVKATVGIKGTEKELEFKISEFTSSEKTISFKLEAVVNREEFMLNGSLSGLVADDVVVIAYIVANTTR